MSEGDSTNWSLEAFSEYLSRTNQVQKNREYLEANSKQLGLTTATTLLSIGPGNGEVDVYLLKTCMSKIHSYIGVDIDDDALEALARKVKAAGLEATQKVHLLKEDVTKWSGPDEAVDVILLCHVLYFLPGRESRVQLLMRCVKWLKPEGRIIIFMAQGDVGADVWRRVGKRFGIAQYIYSANDTRDELAAAGVKNIYKDDTVPLTLELRDRTKNLVNFFLCKNATDSEFKEVDAYFKEIIPDDGPSLDMTVAITVRKEDFF